MAQSTSSIADKGTNESLTAAEFNTLKNTIDGNAADAQTRFGRLERMIRPLEYFGGQAVGFGGVPIDNRAAMLEAIDWCAETGGELLLGSGIYGVDGPVPLRSYASISGLGKFNTHMRQLASTPTDIFTSTDGVGESIAFCQIRGLTIDGGWAPGWGEDRTTHTAAGIRLIGTSGGPDDQTAFDREGVGYLSDPFHVVRDCQITNIAGTGIVTSGRGEMQILNNKISACSLYGMDLGAPDCWYANNTISRIGDSGVRCSSGNQRFSNEKYWFTGMRTDQEGVGAGLEIVGAGTQNIVGSNLTTQDTWGPGLVLDGDHLLIDGNFDEAGGGRVEQQGYGWQGARTRKRCVFRFEGPSRRAKITGTVAGGGRSAIAPHLVEFIGSGVHDNHLELVGETAVLNETPIYTSSAYRNSRNVNTVTLNGEILHGMLNLADLDDPTHPINADSAQKLVYLTNGTIAIRKENGGWNIAGATRPYKETIGDGSATSIAITHGLGTADCIVQVTEVATGEEVIADVTRTDADTVTLTFGTAPTVGQYRVLIVGAL